MEIITKKQFEKDIKKLKKQQKDFSILETVLELLISDKILERKYKNHPLVGNWKPCWEIHLEPDWLLIYFRDRTNDRLILYRTGSHSELF
ncbi:MAG: type II toxin-antitoxin system YafQ family toxin [Alphaproteobacteria bacterium]|nr:type II toxin-antitoxin system YafQ family toxin [Alphaproteobacteria bacterium]MBP9877384.1 type II toxin-antitoxin system YafQ family toxin [Alphaproteobacteria bacterium]